MAYRGATVICDPCKAGRHEADAPCLNCALPVVNAVGKVIVYLSQPNNHGPRCPECDGRGLLLGCKGGTWCDCQHRPSVIAHAQG